LASTRIFFHRKNQTGWGLLRSTTPSIVNAAVRVENGGQLGATFVQREEFLALLGQTVNELIVTHFKTTFPTWSGRSSFWMRRKQGMANEQRARDRGEAEK